MDTAQICSDLVKIRSENPPGDTTDAAEYVRELLTSLGLPVEMVRGPDGHWNVLAGDRAQPLLFSGHLDVVPAQENHWTYPPFSGYNDGDHIWGRGATDMKGGCAAMIAAAARHIDAGEECPVHFAFVCDEETGGRYGIRLLLRKKLLSPCDCLIAEPTPHLSPSIGQKGLLRLDMSFKGVPVHGSLYPYDGRSAVEEAARFVTWLRELNSREYPANEELRILINNTTASISTIFSLPDAGKVLRRISYNPGTIHGGTGVNVVAEECTLQLDLRLPWGISPKTVTEEIRHQAQGADIDVVSSCTANLTHTDSAIVRILSHEIKKEYGAPARPIIQWAASDARFLRSAGFHVVDYGPGDVATLHARDEKVATAQLAAASRIFEGVIAAYTPD